MLQFFLFLLVLQNFAHLESSQQEAEYNLGGRVQDHWRFQQEGQQPGDNRKQNGEKERLVPDLQFGNHFLGSQYALG